MTNRTFIVDVAHVFDSIIACYNYIGERPSEWNCWPHEKGKTYRVTVNESVDKHKVLLWIIHTGARQLTIDRKDSSC